jgi:hypothetical protein
VTRSHNRLGYYRSPKTTVFVASLAFDEVAADVLAPQSGVDEA